jgi:positive regulator of sigma E activity
MAALVLFRIVPVAMQAVNTSRGVLKTLSDPQLNDMHREQILQQASLSLLGNFVSITVRGAAALLASFLVIYLADLAGVAGTQAVVDLLSDPLSIIVTTIILTAAWWLWKKR